MRSRHGRPGSPTPAFVLRLGLGLAALLWFAACTDVGDDAAQRRPSGPGSTTSSTEPVDLTGVGLRAVRGSTTSTSRDLRGEARIAGTVRTRDGSGVVGATVIATWYSVAPPVTLRVRTDDDGRYELAQLAGGRWRVRAYRAPDLATARPEELFLAADADRDENLSLDDLSTPTVRAQTEPDPPVVGSSTSLSVTLVRREVSDSGRLRETPVVGESVTLLEADGWSIEGTATKTTGFGGVARWTASCRAAGAQPLRVRTGGTTIDLAIAPCAAGPAPPTTTTSTPVAPTSP